MMVADVEVAKRRIAKFEQRYERYKQDGTTGNPHLYLAYHAAFPLVLTADLLYCLWQTFMNDEKGRPLAIPWIAVANLLLSNLCQEVEPEVYKMDVAVRQELFKRLRDDPKFGEKRIEKLSRFLIEYTEQQLRLNGDDPDIQEFAQAQRWMALAHTNPDYAARELASTYQEVILRVDSSKSRQRAELLRLAAFLDQTAHCFQADKFNSLKVYGQSMAELARGKSDLAADQLKEVTDSQGQIRVDNVILPIPDVIKNKRSEFRPSRLPLTQEDYRNRQILLSKVKDFWVEGVLKQSVHHRMLLNLGLSDRPDAVQSHWGLSWNLPHQQEQKLSRETKAIDKLDDLGTGRRLLILGEPGSGKTITLLELATDLIDRAEKNVEEPIPVVFNLSSWTDKKQSITQWLIEELFAKYQVPRKTGEKWVKEERLLLLLDGLDEVQLNRRDVCVEAINEFSQEYGTQIVVCSRIKDYEVLSHKLNFQGAIVIQPLSLNQVDEYLEKLGKEFITLRQLIRKDEALQELTKSPLLLTIMMVAYQGLSPDKLLKETPEELRQDLFNTYIYRMLEPHSGKRQKYSKNQVIHWLSWLAKKMSQSSQTIFLIEGLQPTWLKTKWQQWLHYLGVMEIIFFMVGIISASSFLTQDNEPVILFIASLFSYLIAGIVIGIVLKIIYSVNSGMISRVIISSLGALIYASLDGLFVYYSSWGADSAIQTYLWSLAYFQIPLCLIFILIFNLLQEKIIPIENVKWSWKRTRSNSIMGLMFGVMIGVAHFLLAGHVYGRSLNILINAIILGISIGLFYGLLNGFDKGTVIKKSLSPNQGIQKSAATAGIFTLIFGLIGGLIAFLLLLYFEHLDHSPSSFMFISWGIIGGGPVGGGLMGGYGAGIVCIQHFILRVIMWWKGYIPWNYARFLDYAADRNLLQKVGGGYIFIHRLLLEHFAQLSSK